MNAAIRAQRSQALATVEKCIGLLTQLGTPDIPDPGFPNAPQDNALVHLEELAATLADLADEPDPLTVHTVATVTLLDHLDAMHGNSGSVAYADAERYHAQDHQTGDNIDVPHTHGDATAAPLGSP